MHEGFVCIRDDDALSATRAAATAGLVAGHSGAFLACCQAFVRLRSREASIPAFPRQGRPTMPSIAIEYFRPEYAPNLVLFHCAQQHMDVSREACAGFHTRQHTVACARCEIGAHHAGRSSPPEQITQQTICDRCERYATRMLRGRLCVSCYNREREVEHGANRKGSTPLLALYTADLLLFGPPPETGFAREAIDADHMLLSFLARDRAEVDRTIRRIQAGGAKILDYSLSARRPIKIFTPAQSQHGRAVWSILHGQHPAGSRDTRIQKPGRNPA